jgi:hypothetical protein
MDSDTQRQVSKDEGEAMAKELEIGFKECSVKTGSAVEGVMFDLVRMVKNEVAIYTKLEDEKMIKDNERRRKEERMKMGI